MIQVRGRLTLPKPVRVEAPEPLQTSYLEIDARRIERNVRAIRAMLDADPAPPGRPQRAARRPLLCGVIKKNAYGLGAPQLAPRLVKAGCDFLSVFHPAEAEELVTKAAVACPILLMLPLRQLHRSHPLYRVAVSGKLHLAIHDPEQVAQVNSLGHQYGIRFPVHLYIDTGMSRSGLSYEQFGRLTASLADYPYVSVVGVYSHFATADGEPDFAEDQFAAFTEAVQNYSGYLPVDVTRHIANSCGMLRDRRYHLEMVRPGLALFGYGWDLMSPGPIVADGPRLEHSLRWISHIIHVQRYPRRTPVGYGSTCRLQRDSVLGVVPVGYGDGYPVALSNEASVRVIPKDETLPVLDAPVLGRVNMDQIVVDLTDYAADDLGRLQGSTVEVISNDADAPNSLPHLATIARTHPYELLCRLNPAIPRKYVSG